jgi:hypothetical protein
MNSTASRFSVLIRVGRKAGRGEGGLCSAALATHFCGKTLENMV